MLVTCGAVGQRKKASFGWHAGIQEKLVKAIEYAKKMGYTGIYTSNHPFQRSHFTILRFGEDSLGVRVPVTALAEKYRLLMFNVKRHSQVITYIFLDGNILNMVCS